MLLTCCCLRICGCYLLLYEFAVATCCCLRIYGCLLFVNLWLLLAVDANLWLLFDCYEFAVAACCCLLVCEFTIAARCGL